MLLRTSISNTKKFFQNTLKNFKSFISGGYQKLPKNPPFNPFSCSPIGADMNFSKCHKDFDNFYTEKSSSKNKIIDIEEEVSSVKLMGEKKSSAIKSYRDERMENQAKKRPANEGKRKKVMVLHAKGLREGRSYLVAEKLKELELIDKSNIEHVLDIEEVLHYYSRLTCPAYVDLVDKFLIETYGELAGLNVLKGKG